LFKEKKKTNNQPNPHTQLPPYLKGSTEVSQKASFPVPSVCLLLSHMDSTVLSATRWRSKRNLDSYSCIGQGVLQRTHGAWANCKNIGDSHLQAEYTRDRRVSKLTTNSSWLVSLWVKEDTSGWEISAFVSTKQKQPQNLLWPSNSQEVLAVLKLSTLKPVTPW